MEMAFNAPVQPGQASFSGVNDPVLPVFYRASKYMPFQSEAEGRPVFAAIDRVVIRQQGEVDSTIEDVHELHKQRWPQQWAAYQLGLEQVVSGTPLIELFPGNPEVVAELKAANIHTIEGLLACPDSAATASKVPFLGEWKKRAKVYGDRMFKANGVAELEAQNKALLERLAALEAKMTEPVKKQKEAA